MHRALQDLPGEDHGFRADIYHALGDTYRGHGRWPEAEALYLKVLAFPQEPVFQIRSAHVYGALADLGYAHSVEAWVGDVLMGGLYGVALGRMFFGESMFARQSDASKVAFVHLIAQLRRWGFELIDCQMATAHLASLGAREIPRVQFNSSVARLVRAPDIPGPWVADPDLAAAATGR